MKSNPVTRHCALLGLAGLLVLAAGCSSSPPERPPGEAVAGPAVTSASAGPIAGYRHTVDQSRFALGALLDVKSEMGLTKYVGEHGVFAVRNANGAVLAVPNADAPGRRGAGFAGSAEAHDARVRAYFVGAGIPEDQIHSVHVNTHGFGHAAAVGPFPKPEFADYDTVLLRAVGGIRVVDSVAWARLGADGDVVAEEVFWPEIPRDAVLSAERMRDELADPVRSRDLLARIGADRADVEVVLRHDASTVDAAPVARASFDVHVKSGSGAYYRHLDDRLTEFRLAHEAYAVPPEHVREKATQR